MMRSILLALPGNDDMATKLAALLDIDVGVVDCHVFPDGEILPRFETDLAGRHVILVCTLARPNDKILPLLFAAATARELGATQVGLVAPYLSYMRQDRRFHAGEAVTSRHFATLLSRAFDWLVTIDPHLHRYKSLSEIYSVPAVAEHAEPLLGDWIARNVKDPFLIGPDEESRQWVELVARTCGADYAVMTKQRLGDRDVRIVPEQLDRLAGKTPVLLDDIISSGKTMLETLRLLKQQGAKAAVAVAVHGVFADDADELIRACGATLVTSNTVPHPTNAIDVSPLLSRAITALELKTGL